MTPLKFPEDVHNKLSRFYQTHYRRWLTSTEQFPLIIKLGMPNEQQAQQQLAIIQAWSGAWQSYQQTGQLIWSERRWRQLGIQRLPEQIVLQTPMEVAACTGHIQHWEKTRQRYQLFIDKWPLLNTCFERHISVLVDYTDSDIERLISVLAWLENNPHSYLYPRQLPLVGVDSKWLEQRKSLIGDLVSALKNDENPTLDFFQRCGLKSMPHLIRLRLLDEKIRARFGGLQDISVPLEQLIKLDMDTMKVYIVENLQTGLAFHDISDAIVIMQLGYNVDVLAHLTWLKQADCIYWGDIDTHGFAILNRARSHLPNLRSTLMDEKTLHEHPFLWSHESKQHRALQLPLLNVAEQAVYSGLKQQQWGANVRLEQERVTWPYAWGRILAEVTVYDGC